MGKITLLARTLLLIIFILGSSNNIFTANNEIAAGISTSDTVADNSCENDTVNPTVIAPSNITVNTNAGSCVATGVSLGTSTTSDNCGVNSIDNNAPTSFPLGTTTVTWTAMDGAGNKATATQTVTVVDKENPTITAPANKTVATNTGSCVATNVTLGTPTTSDNCTGETYQHNASTSFPLGQTTVTWTVTDNAGNSATATQIVTVTDTEKPTISAPADVTVNSDSGSCAATGVTLGTPTTADNCGVDSHTNNAPASFPLGATTITWTVNDNAGNTATATQIVTVTDNEKPSISAPADVTVNSDTGSCAATGVTLGTPITVDNCKVDSHTNNAPASFPLGATTVTWTATDNAGNSTSATQIVTVTDTEKPIISTGSNISVNNDPGKCTAVVAVAPASASDNCGVAIPVGSRDDGKILSENYPVGTTTITWQVTDDNGNPATPVQQTIIVLDNEAPQLPQVANIRWGCEYTVTAPVGVDNCSGEITATTSNPLTYNSAGTYNIIWNFTDGAGNTSSLTQQIIIDPLEIAVTTTNVDCNGSNTGYAEVVATGGVAPYSYNWAGLGSGSSQSNLSAGAYTVTVTDANGCELSSTITISQPDPLTMATLAVTPASCNGVSDGTVTAGTVSGGIADYSYSIDGTTFGDSNTFTGLPAGTHTITVRDAQGCETSKTATIVQPDLLTMTVPTVTHVSCNGGANGTITAGTVSGGNTTFQYSIDGVNFGSLNSFTGLSAGVYTVTARDSKGCETVQTATITEPPLLVMASPQTETVSCSGSSDGVVTAGNVTGGTGEYQYMISGRDYQSSASFTNLAPRTYTITVRDEKGCVAEETFTIAEPSELDMTAPSSTEVTCFGGNDGTVTAGTVTGGTGNYLYSIDNITYSTSNTITGLSAGTHTIFVKDEKNCALQTLVNITEPAALQASLIKTDVDCFEGNNGSITITNPSGGHGIFQYSINGIDWQDGNLFSDLAHGTYSVSIRDKDFPACEVVLDSAFTILRPEAALTVETITTRTTTYGTSTGSATANPVGGSTGYTYEWRKQGVNEILQITKKATNLPAGTYEVTVTDRNGCKITETATIFDRIYAPIIPTSICETEEDLIRTSYFEVEDLQAKGGVGPYTYEWNFGADATPSTATGAGSHRVTYSTTGNKTVTVTVTDSKRESHTTTYVQYVGECYVDDCGSNDFSGSDFFVGDENGNRITAANCGSSTPKYVYVDLSTAPARYSLYIEIIYTLVKPDGTTFTVKDGGPYYCQQDIPDNARTIQLENWECGDGLIIDNVYLTFSNNKKWACGQGPDPKCFSTNDGESISTPLYATVVPNEIACFGAEQGILKVRASGGTPAYDYSLTGESGSFQTTNEFTGLASGTYKVWVRDSKGDIFETSPVTITQPQTPLSAKITTNEPVCFGENATAYVDPSGGTPFIDADGNPYYEYLWNDPAQQTEDSADNLLPGEYTVTVIDANGCQFLDKVTISQPSKLTQPIAGEDIIMGCGFGDISLEANTPEIGMGTWKIISGEGGVIVDPLNPNSEFSGTTGTYILHWTIAHTDGSCGNFDEVKIVLENNCSTLDFDGIDDYVDFGDVYGLTSGTFTLEAWVKPESIQGTRTILSKRNSSNLPGGGYDLVINSGAPTFRWAGNAVSTSHLIGTDRWYHIAVIFKDSKVTLYVDGLPVGNRSAANPLTISAPFLIGAMYNADIPATPKNYFEGSIEEVRIWKTALAEEQLRFMMNQRLEANGVYAKGKVLPLNVPNELSWSSLAGYYHMLVEETENGYTKDRSSTPVDGRLRNITTEQENSAPLPYFSVQDGAWRTDETWARPTVWDPPNSKGINGEYINWNIVEISHKISSGFQDIYILGLISKAGNPEREYSTLNMEGSIGEMTGNGLTVTHYLQLDGVIDLNGESQLVQTKGSILEELSGGYLEREQQGTASSFNYNYWSSPVVTQGNTTNSTYTVATVMMDGSPTSNFGKIINFENPHTHADGPLSNPLKISNYWINKFRGISNTYSEWKQIGSTGILNTGEGYTMKGSSGDAAISVRQNYLFRGKPNNGIILLNVNKNQNYLLGNPYPSAIDINKFILDNLNSADVNGATNTKNVFNGAVYFWDHFSGKTHNLAEYVGGYATRNLTGGVPAASTDERINANNEKGTKIPGRYIPVAQGFFINTILDPGISGNFTVDAGDVIFQNSQRGFVKETDPRNSQFMRPDEQVIENKQLDTRARIRLDFRSSMGYNRQILVGTDPNTTNDFDLGYDASLNDNNLEDMYWLIDGKEFVIQGVPHFNLDQVLKLGVKTKESGEVSIKINELENISPEVNIYLRDTLNNSYHNLRESDFTLTLEAGDIHDRFELVFQEEKNPEDLENEPGEEGDEDEQGEDNKDDELVEEVLIPGDPTVSYMDDRQELLVKNPELYKINKIILHGLTGQIIEEYDNIETKTEIFLPVRSYSSAVYVVKMFTDQGIIQKKIIINN